MGVPDRAPTRETVQMNGPGGLRGLVALALALAIPPCASGATNLSAATALAPHTPAATASPSIAITPIARVNKPLPCHLTTTGSPATTTSTLHDATPSLAITTLTLVTTTSTLPITTLTLVT